MKSIALAACVIGAAGVAFSASTAAAAPRTLCVGSKPGCFLTIQPAVNAAHDGDTIAIAPGTYPGGVTIDVSVTVVGAGAASTIIKGGGPVLTLGVPGAPNPPTISITGVTVTGGVANGDGNVTFVALGGGVLIPGSTANTAGAAVTIRNSVITGNRATPATTVGSGEPCGSSDCPFAGGFGGGIADVGKLTLINTTVSNNTAGGGVASSGGGGGIWTATNGGAGALTLINSTVTGNRATVSPPNGQFVSGGGIEVQDGETFVVTNSVISNNTGSVSSSYPSGVDSFADGGGIHVGGLGTATIQSSRITGNVLSASNAAGPTGAGSSGLAVGFSDFCVCNQTLVLKDAVISGNRLTVNGGDGSFAGNAVEIDSPARSATPLSPETASHRGYRDRRRGGRRLHLRRPDPARRHAERVDQRQHRAGVVDHRTRGRSGSGAHQRRTAQAPQRAGHQQHGHSDGNLRIRRGRGHLERPAVRQRRHADSEPPHGQHGHLAAR